MIYLQSNTQNIWYIYGRTTAEQTDLMSKRNSNIPRYFYFAYLDFNIRVNDDYIHTSVYNKQDDFGFPIAQILVEWWSSQTNILLYLHFPVNSFS